PLVCSPDIVETLRTVLVATEQARAARFLLERDRRRFIVTRATLRRLLGDLLALPPREVHVVEGAYGKPALAPAHGSAIHFNVSHSGDLSLLGFTLGSELGLDLEEERSDLDVHGMAQVVFSPAEQGALAALEPSARQEAFFRLWALKEAVIKAEGWGFAFPSHTFTVSVAPGEFPLLSSQAPSPLPLAPWSLRELEVARGYAAALAVKEKALRLVLWQAEAAPLR
ncbi:MAG: 4'-phosphopantetheinyl transferase superfamily protein, partial [Myxococcaceae bacterium]|nr:4'-phosphopantetheinyl transferase superfamily protein [Myxococcaceae bacterium]